MSVQTTPIKITFQHTSMYLVDFCIRLIPFCPLLSGKPLMFFTINTIISWSAVNPGELQHSDQIPHLMKCVPLAPWSPAPACPGCPPAIMVTNLKPDIHPIYEKYIYFESMKFQRTSALQKSTQYFCNTKIVAPTFEMT